MSGEESSSNFRTNGIRQRGQPSSSSALYVNGRPPATPSPPPKPTPWTYMLIRWLFKFVLKVFYSSIVIENEDYIPKTGGTIICANHGNSLTDALMLITSVSSKKRNSLRMTAKSTLFGQRTFSSWLIENVGSVPVKRRQDDPSAPVDNTGVMDGLVKALEEGDVVAMFPEGMSRYHAKLSPLKSGVARIASDVLSKNASDPNFEITLLTCSITYIHPQRFRSDVLVTFNPPLRLRPSTHPNLVRRTPESSPPYESIASLTRLLQTQISSGTIDAPSWDIVRVSKTATRMYCPLGTKMTLGDWVRIVRAFIGGLSSPSTAIQPADGETGLDVQEKPSLEHAEVVSRLVNDLKSYQDALDKLGLKDDRIRREPPLSRLAIMKRILIRLMWLAALSPFVLPGLVLWIPIFLVSKYFGNKMKNSGPVWKVWDEIAQQKLLYGLASGVTVWIISILATLPIAFITAWLVPLWMWMTLRWTEDGMSSIRAVYSLWKLFWVDKKVLDELRERRRELYGRVRTYAVSTLRLPEDPEEFYRVGSGRIGSSSAGGSFESSGEETEGGVSTKSWLTRRDKSEKGRVKGSWDATRRYFSLLRRRKRDWNETMRWYDLTDFPEDEPSS